MRILATPCKGKELLPGDLFSTAGPEYWDHYFLLHPGAIGERVYIRTAAPTPPGEEEEPVYRLMIADEVDVTQPFRQQVAQLEAENRRLREGGNDFMAACQQILRGWGHQDGVSKAVEMARAALQKHANVS